MSPDNACHLYCCRRLQLTIVLPSAAPLDRWQATLLRRTSCWPVRLPQEVAELHPPSKAIFIRLRQRGQSKHILGGMKINWKFIYQNLWTAGPTVLDREALYKHLFLNRNCSTSDAVYKGPNRSKWEQLRQSSRIRR